MSTKRQKANCMQNSKNAKKCTIDRGFSYFFLIDTLNDGINLCMWLASVTTLDNRYTETADELELQPNITIFGQF